MSVSEYEYVALCHPQKIFVLLLLQMKLINRVRITAVMAVAFTAEHADAMILSAMYLAIGNL